MFSCALEDTRQSNNSANDTTIDLEQSVDNSKIPATGLQ